MPCKAVFSFWHKDRQYAKGEIIQVDEDVQKTMVASGLAYYDYNDKTKNELLTKQAKYWQDAKGCCGD